MSLQATHTPGPWRWVLNPTHRMIELVSDGIPGWSHEIVMDFVRWGIGGATPRFRKARANRPELVLMERGETFGVAVPGRKHHAQWLQNIDHPDARLMAASPRLLAACEHVAECLKMGRVIDPTVIRDAIFTAKGVNNEATDA